MNPTLHACLRSTAACLCLLTACGPGPRGGLEKPPAPPPAPLVPAVAVESWRSERPPAGSPGFLQMPTPSVQKLGNGLTVYCLARSSGPVSLSLVVNRGAGDALPGRSGQAALAARLLVESTRRKNALELAKAAEMLGSTLSSSAQRDYVAVSLETLPSDFEPGLALLGEVLREPAWSAADFARVRDQWLDDLRAERQSPTALAALVALRATFGKEHGAPVNGSITDVKNLAVSDLKRWYETHVSPSNVALVVVGAVDPENIASTAGRVLGNWHRESSSRTAIAYQPLQQDSHQVVLVDRKGAVQSAIVLAQPFPRRLEPGHEARLALNDVIGGLFTSRINMNLREQHAYTYGAHSTVIANRNFGVFLAQTSVRTDATAPALTELLTELEAVAASPPRKPLVQDELVKARADLSYRLGAHLERNRMLAADVENIFVQGLAPDYLSVAAKKYATITLQELAAQARLLTPRSMAIVIVGDRDTVRDPLTKHGYTVVEPEPGWVD